MVAKPRLAKPHLSDTDTINSVGLKGALEHCFCLDNNAHGKKSLRICDASSRLAAVQNDSVQRQTFPDLKKITLRSILLSKVIRCWQTNAPKRWMPCPHTLVFLLKKQNKTNPLLWCQSFFWFFIYFFIFYLTSKASRPHSHKILRTLFLGHFSIMVRFDVELHGWGKLSSDKSYMTL